MGADTMLRYAYVVYLVTLKCPDLEQITFEYYYPDISPKWSVFLWTDRVTTNVCVNECFVSLFFFVTILLTYLFHLCCAPLFVDAPPYGKLLRYFQVVELHDGINCHYLYLEFYNFENILFRCSISSITVLYFWKIFYFDIAHCLLTKEKYSVNNWQNTECVP
jgi:hypothetical protein